MPPRPRRVFHPIRTAIIVTGALSLAGCAAATETAALAPADEPLPASVPAGTRLVAADQNEALQTLMRASGEHDRLAAVTEYANFLGGPAILEAIRAGAIDLAVVGDTPPIQAHAAGEPVHIVGARKQSRPDYRLATAPGVEVHDLADLRGKKITYGEGTGRQPYVLRALQKAGLTKEDVELVPLKAADFPDAIRTGQVDVAVLNEPHFTRYIRDYGPAGAGAFPESEIADVASGLQYIYARGEALADPAKAAAIRDFVQKWVAAAQWSERNPDAWIQAYHVRNQQLTEQDGRSIVEAEGTHSFPELGGELIATQQRTIDLIHAAGDLPAKLDAAEEFDVRFDAPISEAAARAGADRVAAP